MMMAGGGEGGATQLPNRDVVLVLLTYARFYVYSIGKKTSASFANYYYFDRAIAQAVSRQLPTAAARVPAQVRSCYQPSITKLNRIERDE
jgi:hypothetical protein